MTSFVAFRSFVALVDQFLCMIRGKFYGGLKMGVFFSPVETENFSPLENKIVVFLGYEMIYSQRRLWRRTAPSLLIFNNYSLKSRYSATIHRD